LIAESCSVYYDDFLDDRGTSLGFFFRGVPSLKKRYLLNAYKRACNQNLFTFLTPVSERLKDRLLPLDELT
jgi:hypothetical protein